MLNPIYINTIQIGANWPCSTRSRRGIGNRLLDCVFACILNAEILALSRCHQEADAVPFLAECHFFNLYTAKMWQVHNQAFWQDRGCWNGNVGYPCMMTAWLSWLLGWEGYTPDYYTVESLYKGRSEQGTPLQWGHCLMPQPRRAVYKSMYLWIRGISPQRTSTWVTAVSL